MGSAERQFEIDLQASYGMDEAAAWHTVGIICDNGQGIGTGVAVKFGDRHFILTAAHVIKGIKFKDLWFLCRPPGSLVRAAPSELSSRLHEVGVTPRQKLPIKRTFVSSKLDVALLEVPSQIAGEHRIRFFDVTPDAIAPLVGTPVLSKGYPSDLAQPMGGQDKMLVPAANMAPIKDPKQSVGLKDFDSRKNFLVPFELGRFDMGARGFSGAGGWFHHPAPGIWHPNLRLAGMATHYYPSSKTLVLLKIERIVEYLKRVSRSGRKG
jgi:hypothetical protein